MDSRTRRSDQTTKLAAAKESLRVELGRLLPDMHVTLIGFNRSAETIMTGNADSIDFDIALADVVASGGTDIAAALRAGVEAAQMSGLDDRAGRILLITDGLSDAVAAREAAIRCADAGMIVDVILIDPSDDGVELARAVASATSGRWDQVSGPGELGESAGRSAAAAAAAIAESEALVGQVIDEADRIWHESGARERLEVTVVHPGQIRRGGRAPLGVYLSTPSMQAELDALISRAKAAAGPEAGHAGAASGAVVALGATLQVRPVIDGVRSVPASQDLTWIGDLEQLQFDLHHVGSASQTVCRGRVEVSTDGLTIAEVALSIRLAVGVAEEALTTVTAPMLRRVFASYAHEDEAFVNRCRAAYRALGIALYVDREDLRSGQQWRRTLRRMIAEHDLFQLYWSAASARSPHVAEEWEFALRVAADRPDGHDFVRPLFWDQPMPLPPASLDALHFRYVDPQTLGLAAGATAPGGPTHRQPRRIDDVFPVMACVPDVSGVTVALVSATMASVVAYVEELTSARYYPPPTVLVDEGAVLTLRRGVEVDAGPPRHAGPPADETEPVLDILRSAALTFHVAGFLPGRWRDFLPTLDLDETGQQDFEHIRYNSEGGLGDVLRRALAGTDVVAAPTGETAGIIAAYIDAPVRDRRYQSYNVQREFVRLLQVAKLKDRDALSSAIAGHLGNEVLASIESGDISFDQSSSVDWASLITSAEVVEVATRYDTVLARRFTHRASLSQDDPVAYVRSFLELMREYTARVLRQLGDGEFGGRFRISENSVQWLLDNTADLMIDVSPAASSWSSGPPEYVWTTTRSSFVSLLGVLTDHVLRLLAQDRRALRTLRASRAFTYGVYTRGRGDAQELVARTAAQHGVPAFAVPPAGPKILICSGAFERLAAALQATGMEEIDARARANRFLSATLVHEHVHAAIAALAFAGKGPEFVDELGRAANLNESLAAWAALDHARADDELFAECWTYIKEGEYPEWPYRGAERLEAIHQEEGPAAIRGLLLLLANDPEVAQLRFDLSEPSAEGAG